MLDATAAAGPALAVPSLAWECLPEAPEPSWDPSGTTLRVPLREAVGHVATEVVECYPPGIALLVPGFIVTQEAVDHIEALVAAGGKVSCDGSVKVATEPRTLAPASL